MSIPALPHFFVRFSLLIIEWVEALRWFCATPLSVKYDKRPFRLPCVFALVQGVAFFLGGLQLITSSGNEFSHLPLHSALLATSGRFSTKLNSGQGFENWRATRESLSGNNFLAVSVFDTFPQETDSSWKHL